MACLIASGIALNCKNSMGGCRAVYIANYSDVGVITQAAADDGIIMTIPMIASAKFYPFYFNDNAADWNQKTTVNRETGANWTAQTLTMNFTKQQAAKRNIMKILSQGKTVAVIQDQNGIYHYAGEVNGLSAKEIDTKTGKAKGDFNGYTLILEGEEAQMAQTVDATYITTASTGFLAANVSATVTTPN
jgi:hypothetical protein